MRIAFTHNLQINLLSEEEAEFDSPKTVMAVTEALRKLGHEVEPVEVSGPASRTVARLEALSPDLVFNTAEGTRGRFREAFYPALFERLGLPCTGSDAYVCAVTLDKQVTKLLLEREGVPSPRGKLVLTHDDMGADDLRFPLICKPNYEGSSMGITVDSVVETPEELRTRLMDLLGRYPTGVLVEEFIVGQDVVVPFLERASPATHGILEPAGYHFDPAVTSSRKYQLYDYELKSLNFDAVTVKVPAELPPGTRERLMQLSQVIFDRLGVRDLGRIDFRVTDEGEVFFLEINALPSLEQGASVYLSGALVGLHSMEDVLGCVVESAAARHNLPLTRSRQRRARRQLRVGLTYNLRRPIADPAQGEDQAEFDPPHTIQAIREAIESYGHAVVELEATAELPQLLPETSVDLVFNIAEGLQGRSREAQVPALLELLDIPHTGSDAATLALCHDKAIAKRVVSQAGIPTAPFMVMMTGKERIDPAIGYPAVVKPVAEGSSKGVVETSVVKDEAALRRTAAEVVARYRQAALVEKFLPGREFTVALLGERRPRVLPPLEVVFRDGAESFPVYSYNNKFVEPEKVDLQVPAKVDAALGKELERAARGVFRALDCRDVSRIDFRIDDSGKVSFVECNPLPGLTPKFSDMCLIAEAAGMDYRTLIGEILAPAIRRFRAQEKERILAGRP